MPKSNALKNLFSNSQKFILGIAITIVLVSLILYATSVFLEEPKYEDFCKEDDHTKQFLLAKECSEVGGLWNPTFCKPNAIDCPPGYCDAQFTCRKNYETSRESYSRTTSIIAVISGVLALIAGLFLKVENVSLGSMLGGVVLIFYGVVAHWNYLSKYLRLIILTIVLAILVWFSYKKFSKK